MNPPIAIRAEHLTKTFRSQTRGGASIRALDDLSIDIHEGEILGILGPNGAGKTTFLNILSTLLLPESGSVEILGIRLEPKNFYTLRKLINLSSGFPNYPWCLTVEENLRFYARLYGLSGQAMTRKIERLIELFDFGEYARLRFDELSSGTKQRLSLAKCLLNDPKIIFLDEPTVGLDPDMAERTREIIRNILKETKATVLFTTHNMPEAEMMCKRIAFIKKGRILRLATPGELKSSSGKKDLEEVFIELARSAMVAETGPKEVAKAPAPPTAGQAPDDFLSALAEDPGERAVKWLKRCWAFTYRNFLFSIRNVFAFVELVFWPLVTLISIGLMGDYLRLQERAFSFIMTGAIAGGVLQVTQLDVAYSLLYDVWSKSMKHTLLTPVGACEHLFGSWLIGILRGVAIFGVLGGAATLLFGFHFPGIPATLTFLLGLFGFAFLLGILVSLLILTFGQKAEITAWMFAYLFMLVCGIYYPVEILPEGFRIIAQAVPLTYVLENFRQGFGFAPVFSHGLLKGFILWAAYLSAGLWGMRAAFYRARKEGIILRLSE